MKAALVILDVQEVLLPLMWRGPELADRIGALARAAREQGAPVVAFQQIGESGSFFDPEAPGTRPADRLELEPTDVVIRKGATDAFYGTNLAEGSKAMAPAPGERFGLPLQPLLGRQHVARREPLLAASILSQCDQFG